MATEAEIQADIDALRRAVASGYKSVTLSNGSTYTFRGIDELRKAITDKNRELAQVRDQRRPRGIRLYTGRGL